jgi:Protein of unknown function (DUF2934)
MTPAQIAEAQRMARERKPNMNANEQMIREQAYELWDNAGRPDGRSDEVFRRRADPPIRTGSSVEVRTPKGRSKSGAVGTWQTATLETDFCGQRLSARRARNCL